MGASLALSIGAFPATAGAAPPPTLSGESLFATNLPLDPPLVSFVRYPSCRTEADGTVILEYAASGFASGPYAGTFEESGAITTSTHEFPEDDRLLALQATFSINGGQVTGTKQLTTTTNEFQTATCTGNERGNGPLVFLNGVDLSYTAEVSTPEGTFRDHGNATFDLIDIGTTTNIGNLEERFTSDLASTEPALPTSKDQCKNGGWRNFSGFKNEGLCVAFVERGPKP